MHHLLLSLKNNKHLKEKLHADRPGLEYLILLWNSQEAGIVLGV